MNSQKDVPESASVKSDRKDNIFLSCTNSVDLFKCLISLLLFFLIDFPLVISSEHRNTTATCGSYTRDSVCVTYYFVHITHSRSIEDEYAELQATIDRKRISELELTDKLLEQRSRYEREIQSFLQSLQLPSFQTSRS